MLSRIETVQEHYKDHEPTESELEDIKNLERILSDLEKLYKGNSNE